MNWSKENVIKFIEAYKRRNILWSPKNKNYYNRNLKQEAWDELSFETGCHVNEAKKKIEYLLAALRRERAKILKSAKQGSDEVYQSNWFAFKHLQFLIERNKSRHRNKTDTLSETEDTEIFDQNHVQSLDERTQSTVSTESDDHITLQTSHALPKTIIKVEPVQSTSNSITQSESDTCQLYANYLASKFRGYSKQTYIAVQHQINNLLYDADCGLYE